MTKGALAATMKRFRNRRWRLFAALALGLLLTAQIGLAVHGASHLHWVGEAGNCQLCILNSHLVAETPATPDLEPARLVVVLLPEEAEAPADSISQVPGARGPPAVSV